MNNPCFLHGDFTGPRCQQCADDAFEKALIKKDYRAITDECEARLRALPSGGSLSFRVAPDQPCCWTMPLWNKQEDPPWRQWAEDAAMTLIAAERG